MESRALKTNSLDDFDLRMSAERSDYEAAEVRNPGRLPKQGRFRGLHQLL